MKKNIARYMWFVAVIFFLWPDLGQGDSENERSEEPGIRTSFKDSEDNGAACNDLTPISVFDSLESDNLASEINTLALDAALSETSQSTLEQIPETSLVESTVPQFPSLAESGSVGVSFVANKKQESAVSSHVPSQAGPTLIQLMTQIESSLKTIENAVSPGALTASPSQGTQSARVAASASSDPKKSQNTVTVSVLPVPVLVSAQDKPKDSKDVPMPDDVNMTAKELDALHPISDDTELTPSAGHDIKLCASMPLTGSMALVGRDYLTGINLVFDKFNRAGGLDKKYLFKYSTIDDRYMSTVAKENVMKSLKDSPFFIGNFGSHLLTTVKDLIEKREVLMLFPTAGDIAFRNKDYRYLINFRPSMNAELRALIKYAINNQQRKKIAVFYEENQWGKAGLAAVESTLSEFGLAPCARANYPSNTIAVMPAATEIIKSRPDAVICISTYRPTYNFIQLVLNEGFQHCLFLGLGPSTPMQQLLKKSRGVTIATTSVVPDPVKSKMPIVEAYRKDMARYFPLREVSQYSLEGYIVGSIFVSGLKQLEAPYTVGKLMSFFEGLSRKDFGGFKINFNPKTRELSSRVWINRGTTDDQWDDSFSE